MSIYKLPKFNNNEVLTSYSFLLLPKEEHLITYNQITVAINNKKLLSKAGEKLYGQLYLTNTRLLFLFEDVNEGFFVNFKDVENCSDLEYRDKLWKNEGNKKKVKLILVNDQKNDLNVQKSSLLVHSWECPVCFDYNEKISDQNQDVLSFTCNLCGTIITNEDELVHYRTAVKNDLNNNNSKGSQIECEKCTFMNQSDALNCKICLNPLLESKIKLDSFGGLNLKVNRKNMPNEISIYYKRYEENKNLSTDINDLMSSEKMARNIGKLNLRGDNIAKKLISNIREERRNETINKQRGIRSLLSDKESKLTELDIFLDTSLEDITTFLNLSNEIEEFFKEVGEFNYSNCFDNRVSVKRSSIEINTCLKDKWFMKDLFKEFNDFLLEKNYSILALNDVYVEYNLLRRKTIGFVSTAEFSSVIEEYKTLNKFSKYVITCIGGVDYLLSKNLITEYINLVLEVLVKNVGKTDIEMDLAQLERSLEGSANDVNNYLLPIIKVSLDKCIKRGNVLIDVDLNTDRRFYYYNYLL